MPTKKTKTTKSTKTAKKTTKATKPKTARKSRSTSKSKAANLEKKMKSALEEEIISDNSSQKKTKKNSPVFAILSIVLLLIFVALLLYEFNKDFKQNTDSLISSTGLMNQEKSMEKKEDESEKVESGEVKELPLTIVYNANDADQKQKIDGYVDRLSQMEATEVSAELIDSNSPEGQEFISKLDTKFLPILMTNSKIKEHPQYPAFMGDIYVKGDEMIIRSDALEHIKFPDTSDATILGANPANADVVIIEYASLSCGYCKMMHPLIQAVVDENPSRVSWVYKSFNIYPPDLILSQAAECANDQGLFAEMSTQLFEGQTQIREAISTAESQEDAEGKLIEAVVDLGAQVGVNNTQLQTCLEEGKYTDRVNTQSEEAIEFGISGTPAFFINDEFIPGAITEEQLDQLITEELS